MSTFSPVAYSVPIVPFAAVTGPSVQEALQQINAGASGGTVTSVSVTTANGVSAVVANPTTTPAITVTLGAITPSSVASTGAVSGTAGTFSGAVSGSNLSGSNTGDQTITLTGDVTGSGTGTFAATLANTAVTPGVYTSANITVDAKGRITAAANGAAAGITQLTGDVTAGPGSGSQAATIAANVVTLAKFVRTGTAFQKLQSNGSGADATYVDDPAVFPLYFGGKPTASEQCFKTSTRQALKLPASLTGSAFVIDVNPTATMTWTLNKNGGSIGTVAFATNGVPTVTFASDVTFAVDDTFSVVAPGSVDATGADVTFALLFQRN